MPKDHYKTLGIDKNASKEDIKRAFRKLAHEHHPDKNQGKDTKFKEINEAYSVLSDDNKRKMYDTYGSADPGAGGFGGFNGQGGQGFGGFDFSQFTQGGGAAGQNFEFDLGDIFGEFFGGRQQASQARAKKGRDIQIDATITFKESIFGTNKEIKLDKDALCEVCKGSGGKPGSGTSTCSTCAGQGKVNEVKRSFMGTFNSTKICPTCHGAGTIPKEQCAECHGKGVKHKKETLTLKVPAGIENGETLRVSGHGEAVAHGSTGDLYITLHVQEHPVFEKKGNNLVMDLKVKVTTALLGGEATIETLDGSLTVKIPQGVEHGEILRVKNQGVPLDGSANGKRGDLMITVHIDVPKKISKAAQKLIDELKKEGI